MSQEDFKLDIETKISRKNETRQNHLETGNHSKIDLTQNYHEETDKKYFETIENLQEILTTIESTNRETVGDPRNQETTEQRLLHQTNLEGSDSSSIRSHETLPPEFKFTKLFACPHCFKTFPQQIDLIHHMKTHSGISNNSLRNLKPSFNQHRIVHSSKILYTCQFCGKEFPKKPHFVEHVRTHTGEKPFACEVCGKCFPTKSKTKRHSLSHFDQSGPKHICNVCGRQLLSKASLKTHLKLHTGIKEHVCELCGKEFYAKYNLESHLMLHNGNQPYICAICDRKFKRNNLLVEHMKTHITEKLYPCPICDLVFLTEKMLERHISKHREKVNCHSACESTRLQL